MSLGKRRKGGSWYYLQIPRELAVEGPGSRGMCGELDSCGECYGHMGGWECCGVECLLLHP